MKVKEVEELYSYDYSVKPFNSLRQYWRTTKSFSCIGNPKKQNIFVYLNGCDATYTDKYGKVTYAKAGSLIYAPEGLEYKASFYNFEKDSSCTIGINFRLFDQEGMPIVLNSGILCYQNSEIKALIEKIDSVANLSNPCYAVMKSGIYDIISILGCAKNTIDGKYRIIYKGIEYLAAGSYEMSIEEIAAACNVSVSYFRRLFKEYSGLSPMQYRMISKINKAKDYLNHTYLNSSEISDILHFKSRSFFCQYFKSATGMTPDEFRKAHKPPKFYLSKELI